MRIIILLIAGFCFSAMAEKPNIVFIFTDDHACQSIGAYGSKINKTPNIDRLADEGGIFLNSFCANSICGPSRACILTGKHSHKNGFKSNGAGKFNGEQFTFPQVLQKSGYQTALFGKWHLGSNPTGFDDWEILPGQGSYYNPNLYTKDKKTKYEGYSTNVVTDLSLNWLEKRDKKKPFLLMCQHKAPHRSWSPDLKHLKNYSGKDVPEPATLFDTWENRSSTLAKNTASIKNHFFWGWDMKFQMDVPFGTEWENKLKDGEYRRMTPEQKKVWDAHYKPLNEKFIKDAPTGKDLMRWKYQRYIKNYLRCIDSVDENVGRVLDYLDKNDLTKNTIVIYSSDQGFYLGEHGLYDKRWMFEESLKMPFIIRWPGKINPGSKFKQLIQNIDYAPTFLEACGVKMPADANVQGKSFVSLLGNPKAEFRDAIYYHYYEKGGHGVPLHEGVRDSRYKLINFYDDDGLNLFDLEKDPNEMMDQSKNPEYKEILSTMKAKLEKVRSKYELPPLKTQK
jgi:arylsulfatase A-like enzyme